MRRTIPEKEPARPSTHLSAMVEGELTTTDSVLVLRYPFPVRACPCYCSGMANTTVDNQVESQLSYEQERGKPRPSENHSIVQTNLILEFSKHKEYRVMSELSLELDGRPLTPDLSIYARRPADFRHDNVCVSEPPLVTAEIFSPTQGYQEVMDKVEYYLSHDVKTCWVVNPPLRTITIYSADGSQKTCVEGQAVDPATGLTADLAAVFS
jgi:Uma2 family endonuclease